MSVEYLFSYGTLRDPDIQLAVIGRVIPGEPALLPDYRKAVLRVGDRDYPAVVPAPGDSVAGVVLGVSPEELARMDAYETDAYTRVRVRLEKGREAWVYVPKG